MQSGSVRPAPDGQQWMRLQFWRGQDLWLEVPIGYAEARQGRFVAARTVSSMVNVPLPEPARVPALVPGALVRGDGEHVFLVEAGTLRWVPTLDAFRRRGFVWEQVQQIDEAVLTRWPVGLPLD
jgi:hypothetical protein